MNDGKHIVNITMVDKINEINQMLKIHKTSKAHEIRDLNISDNNESKILWTWKIFNEHSE